ncbi:MAG: HNH endonuclease [Leptolyngbya sp. BL-A-14]
MAPANLPNKSSNPAQDVSEVNPGLELKKLLEKIYPIDADIDSNQTNFIRAIDDSLKSEGSLVELVYESLIRYLIRRLINTSEFIRRIYQTDEYPDEFYVEKIREFLQAETKFQSEDSEKLLVILQLCLAEKNKNRKSVNPTKLISEFYPDPEKIACYICGKSLTLNEVEIEHEWPKTMGGSYVKENLRISCNDCNKVKENFIDGSDFHYEHISLALDEKDKHFKFVFQRPYKVAICSKNGYSCATCGKPATLAGRLNFIRKNEGDSWHFLNIDTICNSCMLGSYAEE